MQRLYVEEETCQFIQADCEAGFRLNKDVTIRTKET